MKRPRAEDEFKFLTLKPLVSPDDPDLTLRLKRTKVVDGIPQYEFEIRHTYESHQMGGCVLRIGVPEDPSIQKQEVVGFVLLSHYCETLFCLTTLIAIVYFCLKLLTVSEPCLRHSLSLPLTCEMFRSPHTELNALHIVTASSNFASSCSFLRADPEVVGHVGYMVKPAAQGKKYAMKACKLLLPIAKQHELNALHIVTASSNFASSRTCELLGAVLIEEYEAPFNGGVQSRKRYEIKLDEDEKKEGTEKELPVKEEGYCVEIEEEEVEEGEDAEDEKRSKKDKKRKIEKEKCGVGSKAKTSQQNSLSPKGLKRLRTK